ncbi:PLP-dependent transferase [Mytilinidion resinicola]|uniref:PLP-dependent transferase n=1 Tax=Mytilinidion resinicola TaxID=574789 RepID=A0A6A6YFL2_9PEZI|nr:PLP-dependent transferase [Mytilinidion resinicola]KAF2807323.1 PLP-dependent transferase [Mytilinidion resinicola]
MATGLSTHMTKSLQGVLPKLAAVTQSKPSSADVIDLSSAENLLVRDQVRSICTAAIQNHLTSDVLSQLPTFGGDVDTRTALASFFNNFFRPASTVSVDQIVLTAGAGSCIEALVHSICDEGDSVIIPGPYWFGFEPYITLRPKVNIITATPISYEHHATDMLATLRATYVATENPQRIKAVILCNPHNPFSQCYPENILRACMNFCQKLNLHFISDELYALATMKSTQEQSPKFISALSVAPDPKDTNEMIDPSLVHIVWSASKLFGLNGLRILFEECGIEYLPAHEGLFVFAKLGKKVRNAEEEMIFFEKLKIDGVTVSPGRFYNGLSTEFGWARITVAVPLEIVEVALERLSKCIS